MNAFVFPDSCGHELTHICRLVPVLTWRSVAPVWCCSPRSTSSWLAACPQYAASLWMPSPSSLLQGAYMTQTALLSQRKSGSDTEGITKLKIQLFQLDITRPKYLADQLVESKSLPPFSKSKSHTVIWAYQGCWEWDGAPLIGPESGISTRQDIFQLGAKLIQFNGKPGEAIVQLIVSGHGSWWGKNNTNNQFLQVRYQCINIFFSYWNMSENGIYSTNVSVCSLKSLSDTSHMLPTWPPDAFSRGWDTTVKSLMPFSKKPVDHFSFLIHHESLNLIYIWAPIVSLKKQRQRC